ncbi:hypothetical protein Cs7R123_72670 [Catellatospora sp. TT07R-123]|uniref:hypothetical protein n=1 Tax=Catellatospora sp. TT07R-123 TaxID=2733863 RepID=UPI001B1F194B|nr:hypothetical protein [Catellatospora sp. TT07R-123]GHJ49925.1 hypothetical protein Cs7R123_72670 [Catellatospora sp. TT07R-123]
MSEQRLRETFAWLAAPVVPAEDPYGRLMRRHRSRRYRLLGLGSALAATVVAVLLSPLAQPGAAPSPSPTPSVDGGPATHAEPKEITPWVRRLIQSPLRGSLAGDEAYLAELTKELGRERFSFDGQIKVLFAGDVGYHRVVIAVRYDDHQQVAILRSTRFTVRVEERPDPQKFELDGGWSQTAALSPYFTVSDSDFNRLDSAYFSLGLAPSGCRIASVDATDPQLGWRDEPTGDWAATERPGQWRRVTCDGQVRYQGPADGGVRTETARRYTQAELDAAIADARGEIGSRGREAVERADLTGAVAPARLLYVGRTPGGPADEPVFAVTKVQLRDGWRISVQEENEYTVTVTKALQQRDDEIIAVEHWQYPGTEPSTTPKPGGAPAMGSSGRLLVLAPPGAVRLQVLDPEGAVISTSPLTDGIGSVAYTRGGTLRLRALDGAGKVVATGTGPLPTIPDTDRKLTDVIGSDWS